MLWAPARADEDPNARVTPFMMADGLYYVGAADIAAYLISTDDGLILIDGGYPSTAPLILENLETLGFEPSQVKIILGTDAFPDHAGGLAALKKATGATLYASPEAGARMADAGGDKSYPPVKADKLLKDGETVALGAMTLTARLTPGRSRGCTTWTFPVRVDGKPHQAVLFCAGDLDFAQAYPGAAADLQKSLAAWEKLPCEVFLAGRAKTYHRAEKRLAMRPGAPNPFVDPAGCKAYLAQSRARLEAGPRTGRPAAPP